MAFLVQAANKALGYSSGLKGEQLKVSCGCLLSGNVFAVLPTSAVNELTVLRNNTSGLYFLSAQVDVLCGTRLSHPAPD